MQDIRIFVASSKELVAERNALAYLVLAKAEEFERRGFRVRLAKWEYVDPRMTEARTEDRYLDEMFNCDAALVLFRNIAGMYTREELDKALAAEKAGTARLKAHEILFAADGAPDSDAARLRASLSEGAYGVWSGADELRARFLALVDRVAAMDGLVDAKEDGLRMMSAFLAADDELAADRDAFADMVLNLNDILARRGVRVKLRFYDSARHREILEASEMALVLYHTNCNAFGPEQMRDAYDRTRRDENPRRLYVFFRDDGAATDAGFAAFRDGFAENLGHFFCRFENADTLKLNFLLSLENALGEGASFVKLGGRTVTADGLEVGEITKLPMVANNGGLNDLLAEVERVSAAFEAQREICRGDPENDAAYAALLKISTKKNELEAELGKEMSRSFDLAKRMAAVSAKEANETIARARNLLDQGRMKEAVELLDGASSEIDALLGDIAGLEDLMERKLQTLSAWIDVELFRADAVLAFAAEPFASRFAKAEGIYRGLLAKSEKVLEKRRPLDLVKILVLFAALYEKTGDIARQIPLLERALTLFRAAAGAQGADSQGVVAYFLDRQGVCHSRLNRLPEAEKALTASLEIRRRLAAEDPGRFEPALARSLNNLAVCAHLPAARPREAGEAEKELREALEIRRRLAQADSGQYGGEVAESLVNLANAHQVLAVLGGTGADHLAEAEKELREALEIYRRLAGARPAEYEGFLAATLHDSAVLHRDSNRLEEAEKECREALSILRRLADENPAKYDGEVAASLLVLGAAHGKMGRLEEADGALREALVLYRRLADDDPARFKESVAMAMEALADNCVARGDAHRGAGRLEEADRELREALALYRGLAGGNPAEFDKRVASSLCGLYSLHNMMGRYAEAARECREALDIYRRLPGRKPRFFLFRLRLAALLLRLLA
jgi:hypothetical protein